MEIKDYDAVVVGSVPNGLAAAITLQQKGLSVLLLEAKSKIGGGLRTEELTLPGFHYDVCSAIHPMAIGSPFLEHLPLQKFGLNYLHPQYSASHPFLDGTEALLMKSIDETAYLLGKDSEIYKHVISPIVKSWPNIVSDVLAPLRFPKYPFDLAKFGLLAMQSATNLSKKFNTVQAKGFFAGMAAHSIQPLSNFATSAIGLVLLMAGHLNGWPVPKEGSSSISKSLAAYFLHLGGKIETDFYVNSLQQLPSSKAVLFDITPRQLLKIAGHKFSSLYKWQLNRYRYGMGVFKVDWALDEAVPFPTTGAKQSGTRDVWLSRRSTSFEDLFPEL